MSYDPKTVSSSTTSGRTSVVDRIFHGLREDIINGRFPAGQHIRQDEIAHRFNTSHMPVREALARLEAHGLISIQRFKGAIVTQPSVGEIEELFQFRSVLESHLIACAIQKMSEASLAAASAYSDEFLNTRDPSRWGELNRSFYLSLYQDSQLPYFIDQLNRTYDRLDALIRLHITLMDSVDSTYREHQELLKACQEKNTDDAVALIRQQIDNVGNSLVSFVKKNQNPKHTT